MKTNWIGTVLIGLVALVVAGLVAFISVSGLGKLYAGSTLVIALAGSLELGKLVAASFVHNYWDRINVLMKTYLVIAIVVLMGITSTGIYGYLTAANQQTVDELNIQDSQISIIELKKERFDEQLTSLNGEKDDLNESIKNYSQGLSNNKIQYTDTTGRLITTTSSSTRRVLNQQLNDAKSQRDVVSRKIESLTDSVTNLDIQILEIKKNSEVASEVGPLKFIAKVTGLEMETITNYLSLLLIFVGDPFAVVMVLVLNSKIRIDRNEKIKEKVESEPRTMYGDPEEAKSTLRGIMDRFRKNKTVADEQVPIEEEESVTEEISDGVSDDVATEDLSVTLPVDRPKADVDTLYEKYKSKKEVPPTPDKEKEELNKIEKQVSTKEQKMLHEAIKHRSNIMGHPYYEHKKFDWKKYKNVWRNDPRAVAYWMSKKKGGEDDFTTKIY